MRRGSRQWPACCLQEGVFTVKSIQRDVLVPLFFREGITVEMPSQHFLSDVLETCQGISSLLVKRTSACINDVFFRC